MKLKLLIGIGAAILLPVAAMAQDAKAAFEMLKKLEGTWEGNADMGGQKMSSKITYKLTAGGSAVVETIEPGSPYEMITVFHLDGKELVLTHYCAAQNQPKMKLVAGKDSKTLRFEFVSVSNLATPGTAHMRNLTIKALEDGHIKNEWDYYSGGKVTMKAIFDMKRTTGGIKVDKK